MSQDDKKRAAAEAALPYVDARQVIGVGTGSTANFFIDALARMTPRVQAAVASSEASAERIRSHGIAVRELNDVGWIGLYVDGADEATRQRQLIKGGGGALTREKIIAAAAERFVCIADDSKLVAVLGGFPLPVEVIPMARSFVARKLVALGGQPVWREGFTTDNGNHILDVGNLRILDAAELESTLNQIPGVVSNGLFAHRPADVLLLGTGDGVERLA